MYLTIVTRPTPRKPHYYAAYNRLGCHTKPFFSSVLSTSLISLRGRPGPYYTSHRDRTNMAFPTCGVMRFFVLFFNTTASLGNLTWCSSIAAGPACLCKYPEPRQAARDGCFICTFPVGRGSMTHTLQLLGMDLFRQSPST